MKAISYILNNSLLFELCTSSNENYVKVRRISLKGNKVSFTQETFQPEENREKWKHTPAILLITGSQVITKNFQSGDTSIKKITENPELLWSLPPLADPQVQTVSFLRKELTEELTGFLQSSDIYVLDTWITSQEDPDREEIFKELFQRKINVRELRRDPVRSNLFAQVLYYKLRLPVLLFLFVILLGNFLFHTHIRQQYETLQSEWYLKQLNNKQQQDKNGKQGRLQAYYQSIPNRSFALIADRIASYVPPQVLFNLLTLSCVEGSVSNPVSRHKERKLTSNSVVIKGETNIPGSVTLFTQFLDKDPLFSNVKIHSLAREQESAWFSFELNVELNP